MTMDDTYRILKTFQIYPEKQVFESLLNALNLIRDDQVSYKDVTDLLSWKCEFPLLPKIDGTLTNSIYVQSEKKKIHTINRTE